MLKSFGGNRRLRQPDPIALAQELIAAETGDADRLADLVAAICAHGLWKERRRRDGTSFQSLAQFVVTSAPHGLGVRTEVALQKLRIALLTKGLLREWVEVMEGAIRPRGRPKTNIANSEDSPPVFTRSRSTTALDRILPRLMHERPDLFQQVGAGRLTVHQAGIQGGIIRPPIKDKRLRFGVVDWAGLAHVKAAARVRLLCEVFDELGLEAQCALLARRLEGVIGIGLAQQWRDHIATSTGDGASAQAGTGGP